MIDKRVALMSVMDQLAKLLPLLASDKAGEAASAARHVVRVMTTVGLDWHDLVQMLKEQPSTSRSNCSPFETNDEALLRIGLRAQYFCNSEQELFADLTIDGHRETWAVSSSRYSDWLTSCFLIEKEKIPSIGQLKSAIRMLRACALVRNCQRRNVFLRVAESDGRIYLDLGDESWRAIEIDVAGWRLVHSPPVRFRRSAAMQPLPVPERGATIGELRPFVNLNDSDFLLSVSFVLDALRVDRPHPVMCLVGAEGTAKSTLTEVLGNLIDPYRVKLRSLPKVRDLFVAAHNQSILCFDNVSDIPPDVSDALCQISSGAGFTKRKNYTDDEEFQVGGAHPIILNGIHNSISRPDLADRAIVVNLPRVVPVDRRPGAEFWSAFRASHPKILGALLDIAAFGLANISRVRTSELSRVADFQRWAVACETAFSESGGFQRAFASNISDTVETLIDNDPVAKAIGSFMVARVDAWEGTAAQLLTELARQDQTEAHVTRSPSWPRDAARLSKALRAMHSTLAKAGIAIEFGKAIDRRRTRLITIRNRAAGTRRDSGGGQRSSDNIHRVTTESRRSGTA